MDKTKIESVSGAFYPSDPYKLKEMIKAYKKESKKDYEIEARALIAPHAGYIYSGKLAYSAIQYISRQAKNIFIFAPAHRVYVQGLALSSYEFWQTPLGKVKVNQQINQQLKELFEIDFLDTAFEKEHSIEVQIPLLQSVLDDFNIIPILYGQADPSQISEIIRHFYDDKSCAFIVSSDLSHFESYTNAKKIDSYTYNLIEENNPEKLENELACGSIGISGLLDFAIQKSYSMIRVEVGNSADTIGSKDSVVGYGSWIMYEGGTNEFIKKYYSDFTLQAARNAIEYSFKNIVPPLEDYPKVFNQSGASFVTLEQNGQLRGCVGSIIAHRPLIEDIEQNATNAAFNDNRFSPLKEYELEYTDIHVSLLSSPIKIEFEDEEDLLNKIVKDQDGLIIKDGRFQAVYLPIVWKELEDKREFLNSLKQKAGLRPDYFSKSFEAYRFRAEYIE